MTPAEVYDRLRRQLEALISEGKGESAEADDLRDRMDGPWYAMQEDEARQKRSAAP